MNEIWVNCATVPCYSEYIVKLEKSRVTCKEGNSNKRRKCLKGPAEFETMFDAELFPARNREVRRWDEK